MGLLNRWYVRYGLAVAIVFAAVLARSVLVPVMGLNVPYLTIYPAMMIVAIGLGMGPGLCATVLGSLLAEYYFVPGWGTSGDGLPLAIRTAILFGACLCAGWVGQRLRAARARAEAAAQAARASEAALRQQVELIDPVRAGLIVREMQRVLRERQGPAATPAESAQPGWRRVPTVAGAAVVALGLLVLLGWVFDVSVLLRLAPGLASMKANTALCFVLAGLALVWRERPAARVACAAVFGTVSAIALVGYATGTSSVIDQLLFHDHGDSQTLYLGRMAPATALGFVVTAGALLLLQLRAPVARWAQPLLAAGASVLGLVAVLGYAYDVQQLYRLASLTSMALHTAIGLLLLGFGLLMARPDGLISLLVSPALGAQVARRLLPAALLLPLVLGWLHEAGERSGVYTAPMGAALFALAMMLCLVAVVLGTARALNRADAVRRETDTQLRSQAELMEQTRDALIVRALDGAIRFWNRGAEALYGWSAAEALGQRIHVLLRTEGLPADHNVRLEQTGHWEGEIVHLARDGRRVTVECRTTAIREADGRVLVLESNRDITERKRAEEEIQRVNENLAQFAYVCSHDLQEPLRIMSNYSQLLARRYKGKLDGDADDFIAYIVEAASRMQKLITDLLAYSRAGHKHVDVIDVDCEKVAHRVAASLAASITAAGGSLTIDRLPTIRARETCMVQLFQNLIGNALKFRGEAPPRIQVSARQGQGEWIFSVCDNGIGIEPQYFDRIFGVFQRLHARDQYEGTGIGLSICKKVVESLGGRIWVASELGQGSTFHFTVPAAAVDND